MTWSMTHAHQKRHFKVQKLKNDSELAPAQKEVFYSAKSLKMV